MPVASGVDTVAITQVATSSSSATTTDPSTHGTSTRLGSARQVRSADLVSSQPWTRAISSWRTFTDTVIGSGGGTLKLVARLTNAAIAQALDELGDLYELDGADSYRVIAYRNAARSIRDAGVSVAEMVEAGKA